MFGYKACGGIHLNRNNGNKNTSQSRVARNPAAELTHKLGIAAAAVGRQSAAELVRERQAPAQWYWLSFASNTGFLGGAIVWAHGIETAVQRARDLNISRGFRKTVDVFCEPISRRIMKDHVPPDLRNRLLSEEEVLTRLEGRSVVAKLS